MCVLLVLLVMQEVWFAGGGKKKEVKKETGLGLTYKKDEDFGNWYSEVCLYIVNNFMYFHQL